MSKLKIRQWIALKHFVPRNTDQHRSHSTLYSVPELSPKEDRWNKALSNAFDLLQLNKYPQGLVDLINKDTIENLDKLLIKVIGSRHPVIQETKRLFLDSRVNFKIRGLLALLFAKAVGHSASSPDYEQAMNQGGISERQRKLADVLELYYAQFLVHNSVLNLPLEKDKGISPTLQSVNGMAVLWGDYLAGTASVTLASIKNSEVLRLVSQGVSDFSESIFHGEVDKNGNLLPDPSSTRSIWEKKTFLERASLLSHGCEGMMVLSGHQELQDNARDFGKFTALALKVNQDMYEFTNLSRFCQGTPFSLDLTPVILHLESDPAMVEAILNIGKEDITNLDFQQIYSETQKGNGLEKATDLLNTYTSEAESILKNLESNKATGILQEILESIRK